jgi:ribosomal protein S18 acetylase RimI-like enzyme
MDHVPTWTVRRADESDAPVLALIGAACFLESYAGSVDGQDILAHCAAEHSEAKYRDLLASGAKAWLVECQPGAAPVGYAVSTVPDLPDAQDGDVELKRIYVLSRFHGSGISATLLEAVIAEAKGFARMTLGVYGRNVRAQAFYAKNGFEPIGTRQFTVGDHTYDDLVLALPLTS